MVMTTLIGLAAGAAIGAGAAAIKGGNAKDILKAAGIGGATGAVGGAAGGALTGGIGGATTGATSGATTGATSGATTGATTGTTTGATSGATSGATTGAMGGSTGGMPSSALSSTVAEATGGLPGGSAASLTEGTKSSLIEGIKSSSTGNTTSGSTGTPGASTGSSSSLLNITPEKIIAGPDTLKTSELGISPADLTKASVNKGTILQNTTSQTGSIKGSIVSPAKLDNMSVTGIKMNTPNTAKVTTSAAIKPATGNTALKTVGKVAGQVGVQGVLSVGTAVAGAKQAKAANEISRQGLLFQKQTYEEQKAERESTKTQLKQDAYTAHTSATAFAENLFGENSNGNLLTDYTSDNKGNYSLLKSSIKTKKSSDLT